MTSLSFPPPKTDSRFDDWMQLLYKQVKNGSGTTPVSTPSTVLPVQFGGSGAVTLSGYLRGNGTSPYSTVSTIPASDISGLPAATLGANLQALDITSGTGIYAVTAYGNSAVRTMTGTASRLTVADGDGVSGNPTFDISTVYVGQTTITTLGTITTGIWNAGAVTSSDAVTGTQLVSNIAIGTAPLVVTSTTLVANLYVAQAVLADTGVTQAAGNNTTAVATTAFVTAINNNASYRIILQSAGSHIAGRVAGTYAMGAGPLAVSGTGTLYPITIIALVATDYPTINGITSKLRIRGQIFANDVAPTGNFTFGLYPITRPAVSGGAGLVIYTLGTVIAGSNGATVAAPAADSSSNLVGADFSFPANGLYVIGVVTTATVAVSAHLHLNAQLQMRNA